jgi:hypothetical protein
MKLLISLISKQRISEVNFNSGSCEWNHSTSYSNFQRNMAPQFPHAKSAADCLIWAQLEKSQWHIETNQVSAKGQLLIEWKSIHARAAAAPNCEMIDGDGVLTEI